MKKLISVLLLVFAIGFVVTGCKKEQPAVDATVVEAPAAPVADAAAPAADAKKEEVKK